MRDYLVQTVSFRHGDKLNQYTNLSSGAYNFSRKEELKWVNSQMLIVGAL